MTDDSGTTSDDSSDEVVCQCGRPNKVEPMNNLQFSKLALNDSYIIGVYPLQSVYLIYEF